MQGAPGGLYTVEITAQWAEYDNDLVDTELDEELPDDGYDLVCFTGSVSRNNIEHLTYLLLEMRDGDGARG